MWQNTTEGDSGANQSIELLITTDGELQVARGDTLDLEVLCSVLWEEDRVSMGSSKLDR